MLTKERMGTYLMLGQKCKFWIGPFPVHQFQLIITKEGEKGGEGVLSESPSFIHDEYLLPYLKGWSIHQDVRDRAVNNCAQLRIPWDPNMDHGLVKLAK